MKWSMSTASKCRASSCWPTEPVADDANGTLLFQVFFPISRSNSPQADHETQCALPGLPFSVSAPSWQAARLPMSLRR